MTRTTPRPDAGFSLVELLVSTMVLLVIAGTMLSGLKRLTDVQGSLSNKSDLYGSVRGAIELLQQEVSQAGSITLPAAVATTAAVSSAGSQSIGVTSSTGMFVGEKLIVDTGANAETVSVTALATNSITGTFTRTHLSGVPVTVAGGFASGIVPPSLTNGSTGTALKLYGNLNDDGTLMYAEYTCDTTAGNVYRNVIPITSSSKPAVTTANIVLTNVLPNPGGTPCFAYQTQTVGSDTYVTDVAVTLTVQTQEKDPITGQYQKETAALLNVSPRNVFDTWETASLGDDSRVQPMPPSVVTLLP